MKLKAILATAMVAAVAGSVYAAPYAVYKTSERVVRIGTGASGEKAGKGVKAKFDTYTILDLAADSDQAPVRIPVIKPNKKLDESATVNDLILTKGVAKSYKKLFMDPRYNYAPEATNQEWQAFYDNRRGDWDVFIDTVNSTSLMFDFFDLEESSALNPIGADMDVVVQQGVIAGDAIKTDKNTGAVKKYAGVTSYSNLVLNEEAGEVSVELGETGYASKAQFKLDKKTTEAVASAATMNEAIGEVCDYLYSKKYASTWTCP